MKEEKNSNAIKEETAETKKKTQESYSIYEYLKNNTTLLIAVVSAMVAIVTMVLKLGSYMYHTSYLKFWDIDTKLISESETYWLEDIALSFSLLLLGLAFVGVVTEIASVYKHCRYFTKHVKKLFSNDKKKFKLLKKQKKSLEKSGKDKEKLKTVSEKLQKETKASKDFKEIKKEFKKLIRKQAIGHLFLMGLLLFAVTLISLLKNHHLKGSYILTATILTFLTELIVYFLGYITSKVDKEKIDTFCNEIISRSDNKAETDFPLFPINKLGKLGIKHYLSNKHIINALIISTIIIITFIFASSYMGESTAIMSKDSVSVIDVRNEHYAIITNDSDNIIAEKIVIDNNIATIFTNEQIIIPKEKTEIKKYTFDKVDKQKS